jgi:hypothetical protein
MSAGTKFHTSVIKIFSPNAALTTKADFEKLHRGVTMGGHLIADIQPSCSILHFGLVLLKNNVLRVQKMSPE